MIKIIIFYKEKVITFIWKTIMEESYIETTKVSFFFKLILDT